MYLLWSRNEKKSTGPGRKAYAHSFPVPAGSLPEFFFKQFYKIVGIQNPHLFAYLVDGKPGVGQFPRGLAHAYPGKVGCGGQAGFGVEAAGQVVWGHIQFSCQGGHGDTLGVVVLHVVDGAQNKAAVAFGPAVVDDLAVFADKTLVLSVDLLNGGSVSDDGGAFAGDLIV